MDRIKLLEQLLGRFLSLKARSENEVRFYLQNKAEKLSISVERIEPLINKYKDLGYINDAQFMEALTHSTVVNKAKGRRFLNLKLRKAGIDKETIAQTLQTLDPQEVWQAMEKRISRYETKLSLLDKRIATAKAYGYLLQAGFSSSEIRPFLDEWQKKR